MTRTLDPEGAHLAALRRLADFGGRRVLEMGCGEGRLTRGIAADAASVLAFDPDAASIAEAQASFPSELADRVAFHVARPRRSRSPAVRSISSSSPGLSDASRPRVS